MKAIGYIALHYGADYLKYALQSVYSELDEIVVLYSAKPSHGHGTSLSCPDTKDQLLDICIDIDVDGKINWINGNWTHENQQRNFAHDYARNKGYDILVAVDFDEVWNTQYLRELIKETYERKANKCLIWMRHLWRSFNYICDDAMRQERIYYLGPDKGDLIYASQPVNQVWHFGYARSVADVQYKISCHGHSAEWLTDKAVWLNDKYKAFPPPADNVHPACKDTWYPKPFDKTQLPEMMREHLFYNMEEIR